MGTHGGPYDIEGVLGMAAPIANSLGTGIRERHITRADGMYLGSKHLHTLYVGMLALHIGGTHEYLTLHIHQGADGSRGHTMLTGTCLGDNSRLAHLLSHQDLSYGVVDFVGTRVVQVLALQIELATIFLTHPAGKV